MFYFKHLNNINIGGLMVVGTYKVNRNMDVTP